MDAASVMGSGTGRARRAGALDGVGGLAVLGGQYVGVGLHGHPHGGVAESFGDDLDGHPLVEQQAGVAVPQAVQRELGRSRRGH
jgi:hypothetical protein